MEKYEVYEIMEKLITCQVIKRGTAIKMIQEAYDCGSITKYHQDDLIELEKKYLSYT